MYLVMNIGCIDCGVSSAVVGVFADKSKAELIAEACQKMRCDALAVLPGAHYSRGARLEMDLAMQLKIQPVWALDYWMGD